LKSLLSHADGGITESFYFRAQFRFFRYLSTNNKEIIKYNPTLNINVFILILHSTDNRKISNNLWSFSKIWVQ
ncbi:MAG: hypothetical protein ACI8RD_006160, partial [Bacillariaceae sp.]